MIPKVNYRNFHQPNKLNSTLPSCIEAVRKINLLKQEIIKNKKNSIEFGRFDPDFIYFEKQLFKLQNYMDLLSCC